MWRWGEGLVFYSNESERKPGGFEGERFRVLCGRTGVLCNEKCSGKGKQNVEMERVLMQRFGNYTELIIMRMLISV